VDTGVGPHTDFDASDGENFTLDGGPADFRDVDGHGTHVAGIICADGALRGIAPAAQLFAARVFPAGGDATNADVAEAIFTAVDRWGCDLINLSLGGPYDQLVEDRIAFATAQGTLCLAAAGNSAGEVEYPGALRQSFTVAALGRLETYPHGTTHEEAQPYSAGLYGVDSFYAAAFSCFGREVSAAAPGVAVISTVPPGHYAALDGTSMACPMATGVAAVLLGRNPALRNQPRDAQRAEMLRAMLRATLRDLHLPQPNQGGGMVCLT
jgi:subtilisin